MSASETQVQRSQFETNLEVTGASGLRDEDTQLKTTQTDINIGNSLSFPLSNLPSELRHNIYAHYFASLPPYPITCTTISSHRFSSDKTSLPPYHTFHPLSFTSPFFLLDTPTYLYYQNTTFQFSCASALKMFTSSSHPVIRKHATKVRILYGSIGEKGADWVFLMLNGFENLREVTWVVDEGCRCCGVGSEKLEGWWGCVRDAIREGTENRDNGVGAVMGKRNSGVRLKLEMKMI